jgi:uncharacterized protein (TIGR03437 family)
MSAVKYLRVCFRLACSVSLGLILWGWFGPRAAARLSPVAKISTPEKAAAKFAEQYGKLPMQFEEAEAPGAFRARGDGYALWLNGTEALLKFRTETARASSSNDSSAQAALLKMTLAGANTPRSVTGFEPSSARSHYFHGNDPRHWRTNVASFARVKYKGVYPGIDLVWYGNQQNLEYDFLIAPGANADLIRLAFAGTEKIEIDRQGNLKLTANGGELQLRKPQAWQEVGGLRRDVTCSYRLGKNRQVEFQLGSYDTARELVIDPVLTYSSLIGGANSDNGFDVAVDAQGAAYVTGRTFSTDFPVVNPLQGASAKPDTDEVFVTKINPAGSAIVYSTYLGGDGNDTGTSIALDAAGSAYICGYTDSTNFPTTAGAPQRSKAGLVDAFVAKLSPAGSALVYSTLLGGNSVNQATSIAVDAAGNAYVAGQSDSTDFLSLNLTNVRQGSSLYRSANGGTNWVAFGNGMPAVQITVLAQDPKSPSTIYAGGRWGIYKSTDGGGTWTQQASLGVGINNIVIDPVNTNTIYAVFDGGGVLKSVNGGASFDAPFNYPPLSSGVNTLALDPKTPSTLYAGAFEGMFKSANGGMTWQAINNGLTGLGFPNPPIVRSIIVDSVNPSVLFISTSRGVFKSNDAGQLWNALSLRGLSYNLAIDPANSMIVYAGSTSGVFKTTDGGDTWVEMNSGLGPTGQTVRVNAIAIDSKMTATLYASTTGFGIFKSMNGGANWLPLNNGLNNLNVLALLLDPTTSQLKLAGTNAGSDAFAAKLNPTGTQWSYFRMLGGFEADAAAAIALDSNGAVYLTGTTTSTNFPTLNAVQPTYAGNTDGFVMKLSTLGQPIYSTYLGASGTDQPVGIGVDQTGTVVIAGATTSKNCPLVSPLRPVPSTATAGDGFVAKLNPQGTALSYSSYIGGTGNSSITAMTVAPNGEVYVAGVNSFPGLPVISPIQPTPSNERGSYIMQLNASGSALLFSSFFGNSTVNSIAALALDASGNLYLTSSGSSSIFPTVNPIPLPGTNRGTDVLIAKIGAQAADLAITVMDRPNPVKANNNLAYEITVTNNGPNATTGVIVTDVLPNGLNPIAADASQGSCSGTRTVTCALGNLAVGAKADITILVVPAAAGTLTNRASVTSDLGDADTTNNSVEQQTRVSTFPSIFGRVLAGNGQGLSGVTVTLAGSQKPAVVTGSDGAYQFAELDEGLTYTVTPAKPGFAFSPSNREFGNLSSDQRADFTAIGCSFTASPVTTAFPAIGGTGSLRITANDARCAWTARTTASWIHLMTPSGSGTSTLNFTIDSTTVARRGTIIVADQVVTVRQEFNACPQPGYQSLPTNVDGQIQDTSVVFAAADFNGDRITDIVIRTAGPQLVVRYGNGAGGFSMQTSIPFSNSAVASVGADYNRDGRPDIAIVDTSLGTLTILLNDGANGFAPSAPFNLAPNARLLTFGDFTGDGIQDFLFSDDRGARLLVSSGNGGFSDMAASLPLSMNGNFFDPGDFNGDGKLDLLAYIPPSVQGQPVMIRALFGDEQGNFGGDATQSLTGLKPRIEYADYNNDGKTDLGLLTDSQAAMQGLVIAYSRGDGRFGPGITVTADVLLSTPELQNLKAGDANGDGLFDLFAQTRNTNQTLLFIAQGDNQYRPASDLLVSADNSLPFIGDFNGDGTQDVLITTLTGNATLLLNRSTCAPADWLTVTSAASFNRLRLPADSIAAAFGVNLASDVVAATTTPLPTTLGGTTLRIRDSAGREADAPLFFVSPTQINLLVPRGLANGPALVTVQRGGSAVATGVIEIVSVNPGLISADATGTGYAAAVVLRVKADGSQVFEPVVQFNAGQNRFDPVPIDVSNPVEQVFVLLFGTGIRNRSSLTNVVTRVGGEAVETQYAGDQGGFAGLDQLNVRLPSSLAGKGDVAVEVIVDGKIANPVKLRIR